MRRARSALIDEMRGERTLYFLIPKMNIHVSYPILTSVPGLFAQIHDLVKQRVTISVTARLVKIGVSLFPPLLS
jgi:hypothetical protein